MGHVNNAAYVDYLEESLIADPALRGWPAALPRHYRLEYAAAAAPDDSLVGSLWRHGDGLAYRLTTDAGADVLRATVTVAAGVEGDRPTASWRRPAPRTA